MNPAARIYKQTQNETASKERLTALLFEAALRNMRLGATAFEQRKPAEAISSVARANDIVAELLATLDRSKAPELCDQLTAVYLFTSERLLRAMAARDAKPVREAERAFAPIAEAFVEAIASMGKR